MTACLGLLACWPLQAPDLRDAWGIRKLQEAKAVAIHRWQSHTGNIDEEGSWSSGVKASDWGITDEVWVDGVLSQRSLSSGLNQPGIAVKKFVVGRGFRGNIGGPGNPLILGNGSSGRNYIVYRGSGTMYLMADGADWAEPVIVDSPNYRDALHLLSDTTADYYYIYVKSGKVICEPSCLFHDAAGTLVLAGQDANVEILGDAGGAPYQPQIINMIQGTLDAGMREFGTSGASSRYVHMAGGHMTLRNIEGLTAMYQGGGYIKLTQQVAIASPPAGTPIFRLLGGTLDFSELQNTWTPVGDFVGPDMLLRDGPLLSEEDFLTYMFDLRQDFPKGP